MQLQYLCTQSDTCYRWMCIQMYLILQQPLNTHENFLEMARLMKTDI